MPSLVATLPSDLPRIVITSEMPVLTGDGTSTVFDIVISGELASKFTEGYKQDFSEEGTTKNSHALNYVFKGSRFDDYEFSLTLFSGCQSGSAILDTGREIWSLANGLANLAKPVWSEEQFCGSPLCEVSLGKGGGTWWRGKGYFISSSVTFRGAIGKDGYPTIIDVNLTFRRHFGTFRRAVTSTDLAERVAANTYVFSTG